MTAEEYIENATSTQEMLATMVRELSSTKAVSYTHLCNAVYGFTIFKSNLVIISGSL